MDNVDGRPSGWNSLGRGCSQETILSLVLVLVDFKVLVGVAVDIFIRDGGHGKSATFTLHFAASDVTGRPTNRTTQFLKRYPTKRAVGLEG